MILKFTSISILIFSVSVVHCNLLPPDSLDCCPSIPRIINETVVKKCVTKMTALDKKNQITRPPNAPPGGLCLLECFTNETKLAVNGEVTLKTVQNSLYSLLNRTNVRMWKPIIDKYIPRCIGDYQNFKKEKEEGFNAMMQQNPNSKNDGCCPSSGYLVSRIMGEFFIHCPEFSSQVPKCNLYTEQVKKTGLYVVAQDLNNLF